jgi:hypothetical protein
MSEYVNEFPVGVGLVSRLRDRHAAGSFEKRHAGERRPYI